MGGDKTLECFGIVVDCFDRPIEGATVEVYDRQGEAFVAQTETCASGRIVLPSRLSGQRTIVVKADRWGQLKEVVSLEAGVQRSFRYVGLSSAEIVLNNPYGRDFLAMLSFSLKERRSHTVSRLEKSFVLNRRPEGDRVTLTASDLGPGDYEFCVSFSGGRLVRGFSIEANGQGRAGIRLDLSDMANISPLGVQTLCVIYEYDLKRVPSSSEVGPSNNRFLCPIPRSIMGRQVVHEVEFDPRPVRTFEVGENRYAEFILRSESDRANVEISAKVTTFAYDLRSGVPSIADNSHRAERHRMPERFIESADHRIIEVAKSLVSKRSNIDTIQSAFDYVVREMEWGGYESKTGGARQALDVGKGDCSDYAMLLVALLRACDIPAQSVYGFTYGVAPPFHAWVEAYSDEHGWIALDPTRADLGQVAFGRLGPQYIRLTTLTNDEQLNGGTYWLAEGDSSVVSYRAEVQVCDP